ncbi:E3 ubiquitin-protein ligase SH3RF3 isoform X1 [Sphaerodactylus townsendi]|uniref:E3 ubiquitin-protein ligase SH3RF3 isoform X1 n=1 Tax=Sphaerodactylus townsendi TaxID=933632 RepID=UPI0020264E0E|nr:E3 ubiquitin-protein ligase SH3RF3 isoform X1 [Sphaerodactylus townsendi]
MLLGASWLCSSKAAAAAAEKRAAEERRRRQVAAGGGGGGGGGGHGEGPPAAARAAVAAASMDESSLLDLLECSVCLERLDTTAKVLPCQHTFCRRCLESIVSSRHELRCPECRILVGCGVDELPANILLVRLLDGIRQRPRGGGNGAPGSPTAAPGNGGTAASHNGGSPAPGGGNRPATAAPPGCHPVASPGSPSTAAAAAAASAAASLRELAAASRSALLKNSSQLPYGKALYAYEGKEPGDLKFNKGDIIILRRKVDENWYHGELNGNHGFFPASYIQCIKPLPPAPPQGKALYDFEIKDKDQDKDCLTFTKDEILTVIRRVDDNWAEGMLGDKIGIFPILYVELNESAKQLIETDKTNLAAASGSDVSLPADINLAVNTAQCCTLNSAGAVSAIQRHIDGKKNTKKRHSFTALSMTHKSSQALNNRHSMEISAPVLISSSDPRAAARIGDVAHLSSSAPVQDSSLAGSATMAGPRVSSISGDQATPPKVQLPLNIYLALYAYKPQKTDELELRKGEMYRVTEKCQDGWFKGTSLRNGMSGVFPGNYVTPVSRVPTGAGQPRNLVGGSPTAKGSLGAVHPGGPALTNSTTIVRPPVPITTPPTAPQLPTASPQMNSCSRYSSQPTVIQARGSAQMVVHPSVQTQDRPTATVSPLRTQNSPSRLPATVVRPHSVVSPQHIHHSPVHVIPGAQCARPMIPLTSAAVAITPPNVTAVSLNGDVGGGPISSLATCSPTNSACKAEERKNEKKEKKSGLLKLLAGASTKKKPRSPPSMSPTHDPLAVVEGMLQGAIGPELSSLSSHGRAGSCPIESEMQGAMEMEPLHRKTGSLDLNFSIPSPIRQPPPSMAAIRPEPKPLSRERYRVVVPYPPQSEAEIELKEGDIVFVHKKREDGWYKGTLQRNGRSGLFPGSFVESF